MNDEARMTKPEVDPKHEVKSVAPTCAGSVIRHSGILASFVIRHSSFVIFQ
jgi:hypothetical protein